MTGFKHFFVDNSYDLEQQILNGIEKYNPKILVLSLVQYINGTLIDYEEKLMGGGFKMENPNAKRTCGCGLSFG